MGNVTNQKFEIHSPEPRRSRSFFGIV